MSVGIANPVEGENVPGIPGACAGVCVGVGVGVWGGCVCVGWVGGGGGVGWYYP